MSRSAHIFAAAAVLATLRGAALAEEPAAWIEELRALRQLIEQQSKQLDGLSKQVARLTAAVEGKAVTKIEPEPVPAAEPAPEKTAAPAAEEAPKAEPGGLPKHLVLKGETLTSIAKHYNIPLVDLQKANKDLNPAKLQIGQSVTIPAAKNPEPASDKKENP